MTESDTLTPAALAGRQAQYAAYRVAWRKAHPPPQIDGEEAMGIRAPVDKKPEQSLEETSKSL